MESGSDTFFQWSWRSGRDLYNFDRSCKI